VGDEGNTRFAYNAHFLFFQAEGMLARRRSDYITYRVGMIYARVKQLLDEATDDRYRRLKEVVDERVRQTPDVGRWLNARWAGGPPVDPHALLGIHHDADDDAIPRPDPGLVNE